MDWSARGGRTTGRLGSCGPVHRIGIPMFRFLKRYASSDDRRESQHAIVRLRGVKFLHGYGGTGAGTVQGR